MRDKYERNGEDGLIFLLV